LDPIHHITYVCWILPTNIIYPLDFTHKDVIYSGCIPVIIGAETTDYPFAEFVDYASFALFVSPAAVLSGELEPMLLRVTDEEGQRMQASMLKVRHFFVYGAPQSSLTAAGATGGAGGPGGPGGPVELLLRSLQRVRRSKDKARAAKRKQAEAADPFE
jgi:hypothetical protein